MRRLSERATWLKTFHWEDLANLNVDLEFLRHQFIEAVNTKVASRAGETDLDTLGQLADIDELLQSAGQQLEHAKLALFEVCNQHGAAQADQ